MSTSSPSAADTSAMSPKRPAGSQLTGRPRFPEIVRILLAFVALLTAIFLPILPQIPMKYLVDVPAMSLGTQLAWGMVFLALSTAVAFGFVVLYARKVDRVPLAAYGLGRGAGRSLGALVVGLLVAVAVAVAVAALAAALGWTRPVGDFTQGLPLWASAVHMLGLAFLLQGIPEELLFRGYLQTSLRRHGWVAAVWISAAVFGVAHLISAGGQTSWGERILYLVGPFGFAVAAGALRLYLDNVWAAVGIHAGAHVGTFLGNMAGWSGEGPGAWVLSGVVFIVIGVLVMRAFEKRRAQGLARMEGVPEE